MTSKFTISGGSRQGVDYLTIVGARQSGKTEMMLRHGLAEANLGRSVYYEGQSRVVTTESFRRAIALADNYDSVEKIRRAHGNESILFDNGGRILFGVDEARGFTFDTHLIDGANSEPHNHSFARHPERTAVKRPYTIDSVEHFYEDDWPEPEFRSPVARTAYHGLMETFLTPLEPTWADRIIDDIMTAFAAVVDEFVKVPPFSWLDALLRGPVGPPK